MLFLLSVSILISPYKDAGRISSQPILVTILNSNHLFKDYFRIQSYSEVLEVRISMYEFGEHNSAHNTDLHFQILHSGGKSNSYSKSLFEDMHTSKS